MTRGQNIIAISVGNTRTQIGQVEQGELQHSERLSNDDLAAVVQAVTRRWKDIADLPGAAVLLASVNDPFAERVVSAIEGQLSVDVYRVGEDVPIPIGQQLDPETITGADRLLNAAAAFDRVKQACVVVDAGTAVTVDFVDGQGTFHGGAIAPGAAMQLHSLHEHTAALPDLVFRAPEPEPFGRNTSQAMYQGVFHGIRGMVQRLVEQYAEHYGAFPLVIATGGDAPVLFDKEELVDRIVPDLTLLGIASAAKHALSDDVEAERRGDEYTG
ncbi:MAG: type III pantothenate kinase [Phycisphaerales bacterium]|nr:type III pantothenate kinase [Phycisphaerales bacterium]MCI0629884.1 type III pantothenate kinase [Phycisphaerales bacterium]MCI0675309.1 type III pantothenate kinase [Phycisphaerales bacterium]